MDEYIKRNAIKARLEDLLDWCQDLRKPGLEQALAMLNEEPVADVDSVVRCKDCYQSVLHLLEKGHGRKRILPRGRISQWLNILNEQRQ